MEYGVGTVVSNTLNQLWTTNDAVGQSSVHFRLERLHEKIQTIRISSYKASCVGRHGTRTLTEWIQLSDNLHLSLAVLVSSLAQGSALSKIKQGAVVGCWGFYVLATSKVISKRLPTSDNVPAVYTYTIFKGQLLSYHDYMV